MKNLIAYFVSGLMLCIALLPYQNGYGFSLIGPRDSSDAKRSKDVSHVPKVSYIIFDEQGRPLCVVNRNTYLKELEKDILNQFNKQDEVYSQLKEKQSLPDCEGEQLIMVNQISEQLQNIEQLPDYMVEEYILRTAKRNEQLQDYMIEEYATQQLYNYGTEEYALQQTQKNEIEAPNAQYMYDAGLLGLPLAGGILMRTPFLARGITFLVTKFKDVFQVLRNTFARAEVTWSSKVCGAFMAIGGGMLTAVPPIVPIIAKWDLERQISPSDVNSLILLYFPIGILTSAWGMIGLGLLEDTAPPSLSLQKGARARARAAVVLGGGYICAITGLVGGVMLVNKTMN